MIAIRTYDTPVGNLTVLAQEDQGTMAVIAAGFCPATDLVERLPGEQAELPRSHVDQLDAIDDAVGRYLNGDGAAIDEVPVRQQGTEFQQAVWEGLRRIPAGSTRTYGQLAAMADRPKAVRAVGSACGANLVAPFVPCHRALRSDGSVGGYYYGPAVKSWLLDLEAGPAGADG
jgi:methylated-DNA-[protein]-cysteine S-methyltransferase